jgi:phosphatidylglycerophosphate synthase
MASVLASAVAGAALWAAGHAEGPARVVVLLLAVLARQLRLLCNLLDGLVAIEARRRAADGAFWNEFPDRIYDILILAGLGLGQPSLGWAAATLAVFTAYTASWAMAWANRRTTAGPMAKRQRMAVVTAASLLSVADPLWGGAGWPLLIALWLIVRGSALTVARRAARIVTACRAGRIAGAVRRSRAFGRSGRQSCLDADLGCGPRVSGRPAAPLNGAGGPEARPVRPGGRGPG